MGDVEYDNITKKYGEETAVEDMNIHIQDGEFVTLVGPSGCGKTTTLRMIAGLETVSSGDIRLGGEVDATANVHVHLGVIQVAGLRHRHPRIDRVAEVLPEDARQAFLDMAAQRVADVEMPAVYRQLHDRVSWMRPPLGAGRPPRARRPEAANLWRGGRGVNSRTKP